MMAKIISGGQTGVDQGALREAKASGIETGGWAPKGWLTEDGPAPWLADYGLREMPTTDYPSRTRKNVDEADALLVLVNGVVKDSRKLTGGTGLTIRLAAQIPTLVMGLDDLLRFTVVLPWLRERHGQAVLVAGPRESKAPGVGAATERFLLRLFETLRKE
jgi:hypothetical protein